MQLLVVFKLILYFFPQTAADFGFANLTWQTACLNVLLWLVEACTLMSLFSILMDLFATIHMWLIVKTSLTHVSVKYGRIVLMDICAPQIASLILTATMMNIVTILMVVRGYAWRAAETILLVEDVELVWIIFVIHLNAAQIPIAR